MSLLNINSLITTISTGQGFSKTMAGGTDSAALANGQPTAGGDRFERGQWWKNQAVSRAGIDRAGTSNVYSRPQVVPRVRVSPAGSDPQGATEQQAGPQATGEESQESSSGTSAISPNSEAVTKVSGQPLTDSEKSLLEALKKADVAVRAHEMAHLSAAGGLAKGGASFKMQKGPDGRSYAVGGEVQIDVSKAATPDLTVEKMRTVRQAALAPLDPSPQDQRVASQATVAIAEATKELRLNQAGALEGGRPFEDATSGSEGTLSAGSVYREYGPGPSSYRKAQEPQSPSVVAARQHIAKYGDSAFSPSKGQGESLLQIIV